MGSKLVKKAGDLANNWSKGMGFWLKIGRKGGDFGIKIGQKGKGALGYKFVKNNGLWARNLHTVCV